MNTIGERIAQLRKDQNMTQEGLGNLLGVSSQSISKWENGFTMPDIMLLPVIADIFEVTLDELFGKPCTGRSISYNQLPEEAYDTLLETIFRAERVHAGQGKEAEPAEQARQLKEFLEKNHDSQTAFYADKGGTLYANNELGFVFRKPTLKTAEILSDEASVSLLQKLADDSFRAVFLYAITHEPLAFTVPSVAAKCKVEPGRAKEVLEEMVRLDFAHRTDVDTGEEQICVYKFFGGHKLLLVYTIFRLANRLANYQESYMGFRGSSDYYFL